MEYQSVTSEVPTAEDLIGVAPNAVDRKLAVTFFPDARARTCERQSLSLRELAERVHAVEKIAKPDLPLLKLATFGDAASERGSIRHNANLLSVDGIEGDHDAGTITIDEADDRLRDHGIAALLYASPSHSNDRPRWRVLCPLSRSVSPAEREALTAKLNGALGGELAPESFTLSQSYYYGRVAGSEPPAPMLIEGAALDQVNVTPIGRGRQQPESSGDDLEFHWLAVRDEIHEALSAIPVALADEDGGRDLWLQVGMAIHHGARGSDEGFLAWDEWSKGGAKYNQREQKRTWKSFGGQGASKTTLGTLFHLAKIHGRKADPIDAAPKSRLQLYSPADCELAPSRGYVLKGLLAPGDVGCIYGAPGAGKSLLAPHLGYAIARGAFAFGMRTRQGGVLYVAAEDSHGMKGRIAALKVRHGDAPNFALVEGLANLEEDLQPLLEIVAERNPALIVIDTIAMAFPGLEENSAEQMSRVVSAARKLSASGSAVLLIHHDTKAQTPTPRGHSVLNGALDMALQLFPQDESGVVRGRLSKNRNGPCDRDIAFRIDTMEMGVDEDGDTIRVALVGELAPGTAPKRVKLSASERAAMFELHDLLKGDRQHTSEDEWRERCVAGRRVSPAEQEDSRTRAFRRALGALVQKNQVSIVAGVVRLPATLCDLADAFEDLPTDRGGQ